MRGDSGDTRGMEEIVRGGTKPDDSDWAELRVLEESLWRVETRFDLALMEKTFARDFYEIGRSGRIHTRQDCLDVSPEPIDALLPLADFTVRLISADVAQVTYTSHVTYGGVVQRGLRSSIWTRTADSWALRFHQGTVCWDEARGSDPAPGSSLSSRPASVDDFDFLWRLQCEAMRPNVERQFGPWDEKFQRELFDESTKPEVHEIIDFDREPIGCQWVRALPDALELERLQLLPGFQGRGIGTLVMQRLIEKANAAGLPVRLQVFRTSPAGRFYARLGFRALGESESHTSMERPPDV